jgi:ribosomal protein L3
MLRKSIIGRKVGMSQIFDENFYPLQQRASPAYPPITQLTRH